MISAPFIEDALHDHLEGNGFAIHFYDNILIGTHHDGSPCDDADCQAAIDSYNPVPGPKKEKIAELKAEGLRRIQAVFPAIDDFDELDLVREQFLSVKPAARNATPDFQNLIDVVTAGKAAASIIKGFTDRGPVIGYDVVSDPSWP